MATNNSKFDKFALVINAPKEKATHEQASDFFNVASTAIQNYNKIKFFASIIHDRDKLDNGEPKTIHLHIYFETYQKATILGTLKELSMYLNIDKQLLSLSGSNNEFLMVQYLTHKNQPEKTQYKYSEIRTNNAEELDQKYNNEYKDSDTEILEILETARTTTELARKLGPTKANKYLRLFDRLLFEKSESVEDKLRVYDHLKSKYGELLRFVELVIATLENGLTEREKRLINYDSLKSKFERDFFDEF